MEAMRCSVQRGESWLDHSDDQTTPGRPPWHLTAKQTLDISSSVGDTCANSSKHSAGGGILRSSEGPVRAGPSHISTIILGAVRLSAAQPSLRPRRGLSLIHISEPTRRTPI